MTTARFASIVVTISEHQSAGMEGVLLNSRAGLAGIFREKTVFIHPYLLVLILASTSLTPRHRYDVLF